MPTADDDINVHALHFVGGRVNPEPSKARPAWEYGDPAKAVKFERETCKACKYERIIMAGKDIGIGICQKKNKDGSKRLYGSRCGEYREKGTK